MWPFYLLGNQERNPSYHVIGGTYFKNNRLWGQEKTVVTGEMNTVVTWRSLGVLSPKSGSAGHRCHFHQEDTRLSPAQSYSAASKCGARIARRCERGWEAAPTDRLRSLQCQPLQGTGLRLSVLGLPAGAWLSILTLGKPPRKKIESSKLKLIFLRNGFPYSRRLSKTIPSSHVLASGAN